MTTATTFAPLIGPDDPRVLAFLRAWHENGRGYFAMSYPDGYSRGWYDRQQAKTAKDGRLYINLDDGTSGVMMVEKATGFVYGIKAYGRINRRHPCGQIEDITADYEAITKANRLIRAY